MMQQALRRPATAATVRAALATTPTARASSSTTTPRPKKPSPYRLPHLPAFLSAFAPLHASGWRLGHLPSPLGSDAGEGGSTHGAGSDMLSGADLQGRVLVRAYGFPATRDGWRGLAALAADITRAVEAQDHHPAITIAPLADLPLGMREHVDDADVDGAPAPGYVLHLATHTHTPLPPLPLDSDGAAPAIVFEGKPRPGVTGKDLRLADAVEKLWLARSGPQDEV
ncbi:uncharacterized protein LOC62_01G000956 [Vanrija pseudolonga]|uniref:Uncharacterized protein n=1 Tax=Vanrija pseudolonga TaxID=143232 RepID=A0AAF1BIN3_9TREE|nr:hypothetical protein LOC62_01G000956 [Vanrija pseudolonga]